MTFNNMIDKITEFLRAGERERRDLSETPDLLEVLGLDGWYTNLSSEDRQLLYDYSTAFGLDGEFNQLDGSVKSTSQTQQSYLQGVGSTAVSEKDYDFAERILLKALDAKGGSPSDRHFVYNSLIDLYYKQRDERDDAIEKCIVHCSEDIASIDAFLSGWEQEHGGPLPRIPSFKRLAIIYEKQGKYDAALDVCEQALQRGLEDGTKGGFEGRKQRILKKMD